MTAAGEVAAVAGDATPTVAGAVTPTVALVAASAAASAAGRFHCKQTEKRSNPFYFCSVLT